MVYHDKENMLTGAQHVGGHDFQRWLLPFCCNRCIHRRVGIRSVQHSNHGRHVDVHDNQYNKSQLAVAMLCLQVSQFVYIMCLELDLTQVLLLG
jgi:hypothetical protein